MRGEGIYLQDGPIGRGERVSCKTHERRADRVSQRTHGTQDARVYSHNGPMGRKTRGYILTTDPWDAGSA
eukprot:532989-Prorocentrum_minimum.AAC.1